MRLEDLRESKNVERSRGGGGRKLAMGGGIGAIIMALVAIFIFKQDPAKVMSGVAQNAKQAPGEVKPLTPKQEKIDRFVRKIKGSTEDVWTNLFRQMGAEYRPAKLKNYDEMTRMESGQAVDSRMGPFYLPSEERIYIDTSFFEQMDKDLGGGGDFAYAYVIAHEVGHHIQKLTGMTTKVHNMKGKVPEVQYNQQSVRLELQADFYAGVWAHHANKDNIAKYGRSLLEEGDIEEAMRSAKAIGDDTLQKKATGQIVPETFSHGTSEQRMRWFIKGIRTGDFRQGDTFTMPYSQL